MRNLDARRRFPGALLAWALLGAILAPGAPATPKMIPGWPAAAGPGPVEIGPGGSGIVVLSSTVFNVSAQGAVAPGQSAVALRPDGAPRFSTGRPFGCANCPPGQDLPARWPDGSYGPFGAAGGERWAVTRTGSLSAACLGAVLPGGACVSSVANDIVRAASPGAAASWTFRPPGAGAAAGPTRVVVNGDIAAVGLDPIPGPPAIPGRVIGVHVTTGAERWRRDFGPTDPVEVVAPLHGGGVVVTVGSSLVAIDQGGTILWSVPVAGPVEVLPAPGRVLVNAPGQVVRSLVARTGKVAWTRRASRALSAGPRGVAYLAEGSSLVAVGTSGRVRWRYPTAGLRVEGARELANGNVGISVGGRLGGFAAVINPRARARVSKLFGMGASADRVSLRCRRRGADCLAQATAGVIVRFSIPRAAKITLSLTDARGRQAPIANGAPTLLVRAPAGTSHVRVLTLAGLGPVAPQPGRYRFAADWRDGGRPVHLEFALTLVP